MGGSAVNPARRFGCESCAAILPAPAPPLGVLTRAACAQQVRRRCALQAASRLRAARRRRILGGSRTANRPRQTMAPPALHTEFLSVGAGVSGYLAKPSGVPGI